MPFPNLRIVLVETTHPGNIGGAARAMKNMCLDRLYLVAPRAFPHAEATARASGADDVLAAARVCGTLDEAIADCCLVFGASARPRTIVWPQTDARGCADMVAGLPEGDVAIVFGRESSGLTNQELERCNYLLHIPCNPDFSSLNIAAALQVVTYELMLAHRRSGPAEELPKEDEPATMDELDRFYGHLESTLVELDFLDPANPRQLMRRLRRLFNRAQLERTEVNILRGILTAARKQRRA